jgi:uroporphyrin-3 C-methyltransferase
MSEKGSDNNHAATEPDEEAPSQALAPSDSDGHDGAPARRLPLGLAIGALALSVGVAAGGGYGGWQLWQRFADVREQADQAASRADQAASRAQGVVRASELDERAGQLASRIDSLDDRVASLSKDLSGRGEGIDKLSSRVDDLASAQESLDRRMAEVQEIARTNKDEWKRSEAAYLATVAVHRLRFYRDVDAALGALKEAHELLSDFGGEYIEARQGIARAIDRLIEVDPPRIATIEGRLAELRAAVDELPTTAGPEALIADRNRGGSGAGADDGEPARMKGDGWRERARHAWDQFTGALGGLVTISNERNAAPLRTPEQRFFLVQNLKVQIEAARLAALRGDQGSYEASLERILGWLDTYFDGDDDRVKRLRERVAEVAEARVSVELPDIASMVERVRSFDD